MVGNIAPFCARGRHPIAQQLTFVGNVVEVITHGDVAIELEVGTADNKIFHAKNAPIPEEHFFVLCRIRQHVAFVQRGELAAAGEVEADDVRHILQPVKRVERFAVRGH